MACTVLDHKLVLISLALLLLLSLAFGIGTIIQRRTYITQHTIVPCTITTITIISYRHCQATSEVFDCQCLSYCSTYFDLVLGMNVGNSTILIHCKDDVSCTSKYSVGQRFSCIKDKYGLMFGDHVSFDAVSATLLMFTCLSSIFVVVLTVIIVSCCCWYSRKLTYRSRAFNALDDEL